MQESKDWLKRAAAMRTSSAALLTIDELKAFLKVVLVSLVLFSGLVFTCGVVMWLGWGKGYLCA